MKLCEYLKEKKLGLSIYLLFFVFLIASLIVRNIYPGLYPFSIFFVSLIFIFSQYFDFEYKYFFGFGLFMLIICPMLLIADCKKLAEYFANYVYGFLVLGIVGYSLDNLRGKLKKKGYFKIYRLIFLSFLILVLISPLVIYRKFIPNLPNIIKNASYYVKKENIKSDGLKMVENIIITVENPIENTEISGKIKISGWAIEGNSTENSGLDGIEIFIDGKPGMGIRINSAANIKEEDNELANELVNRLYKICYGKEPDINTVSYWSNKLELGEILFSDIANNFILSKEFKNRNLSNEEYINVLYRALLNREPDSRGYNYWLDKLNKDLDRGTLLDVFLNSVEFKGLSRVGFLFNFDSTKFKNGEHKIYIYAHSPYFGWDYVSFDVYINN